MNIYFANNMLIYYNSGTEDLTDISTPENCIDIIISIGIPMKRRQYNPKVSNYLVKLKRNII